VNEPRVFCHRCGVEDECQLIRERPFCLAQCAGIILGEIEHYRAACEAYLKAHRKTPRQGRR